MSDLFDVDLSRKDMVVETTQDEVQIELVQNILKATNLQGTLAAAQALTSHLLTHPIDEALLKQLRPTELYNVMGAQMYLTDQVKDKSAFQQSCIAMENILEGFEKVRDHEEALHYARQYIGILGRKLERSASPRDIGLHEFTVGRLRRIVISPEGWRTNPEIVCNVTTRLANKALEIPVCKEALVEVLVEQGASKALRLRHHKLHPAVCQTLHDIAWPENGKKSLYEVMVSNSLDKTLVETARPVKMALFPAVTTN